MIRIAYLNQDFPPEVGAGPARVLELSKHWQAAGAEVTVVTGMPNRRLPGREEGDVPARYRGKLFLEEEWEGLRVLRSWLYTSASRGFVSTILNNASFMATGAAHGLLRAGAMDVLVASSPPFLAHLAGEVLRLGRRVPMVLEVRDLWPDYMVEMGVLKGRTARRALFGLERHLLRRAERVVVVTESFRRRIAEKGVPPDRIHVIPNGVDLDRYHRDEAAAPPIAGMERRNGEVLVGYLGNFGAGQRLTDVVEAAARLEEKAPDVRFVLAGDGKDKPAVERRARELALANLTIHPPIEKDATPAFYNACDVCLVPLAPLKAFEETVPSKLFEILACERPVLASVAGEAAAVVEASGGGVTTPPGDADAIAAGILGLRALPEEARRAMGRRGRAHVAEHYSRERLAERYLELLVEVVEARGRR